MIHFESFFFLSIIIIAVHKQATIMSDAGSYRSDTEDTLQRTVTPAHADTVSFHHLHVHVCLLLVLVCNYYQSQWPLIRVKTQMLHVLLVSFCSFKNTDHVIPFLWLIWPLKLNWWWKCLPMAVTWSNVSIQHRLYFLPKKSFSWEKARLFLGRKSFLHSQNLLT